MQSAKDTPNSSNDMQHTEYDVRITAVMTCSMLRMNECYDMLHMLACPPFPMMGLRDSDLRLSPSRYTCLEIITFILKACMDAQNCLKKTTDLVPLYL